MTTIGKFKKNDQNEYVGAIFTIDLQSYDVRIVPRNTPAKANALTHRVTVGEVEIGVAWTKIVPGNGQYLRLNLDEPSFAAPIYADLVKDRTGDGFTLILVRDDTPSGGG